jgi:hypothetical protein
MLVVLTHFFVDFVLKENLLRTKLELQINKVKNIAIYVVKIRCDIVTFFAKIVLQFNLCIHIFLCSEKIVASFIY